MDPLESDASLDALREFALSLMPDEDAPPPRPTSTSTVPPTDVLRAIVPGLLGEGLTMLVGSDKAGKSLLALDFAIAVATGVRALQSLECDKGVAIYVDYENGHRRLRARLERLAPGGDYHPEAGSRTDMPGLIWFHGRLPEDVTEEFEKWRSHCGGDLRLIVFDAGKSLARLSAGGALMDRKSRAELAERLETMQSWAVEHGVAVLALVQTPTRGPDPAMQRLFALADAVLTLEETAHGATLKVRSRDNPRRAIALAFDGARFSIIGEAGAFRYSLQRSQILEALQAVGGPAGPSDVAGALGFRLANVKKMMFRMARSGELKRQGRGRYLLPHLAKQVREFRSPMSPTSGTAVKTLS